MREIRFRAWDKEEKLMAYDIHDEYDSIGGVRYWKNGANTDIQPCESSFCSYLDSDNYIVMQFSGIRDINGREVFEGDIVKVDRNDSFSSFNNAIVGYADTYGAFLLQYTKNATPGGIISRESIHSEDGMTIYDYCTAWEIEVIGNIYENGELLNER